MSRARLLGVLLALHSSLQCDDDASYTIEPGDGGTYDCQGLAVLIQQIGFADCHELADYIGDGSMLAAAWVTGEVAVFSTASTARLASFQQEDLSGAIDMLVLAFSPDGGRLAVGGGACAKDRVTCIVRKRPAKDSELDVVNVVETSVVQVAEPKQKVDLTRYTENHPQQLAPKLAVRRHV